MTTRATSAWPVFGSLQGYRASWIRPDIIAGMTVWAVLVPEALAYATIAGVPPVIGLYAAIPSLILYAAAGSSRHLVVGPMSATAALSAAIVAPIAGADDGRFLALSTVLAITTGIVGLIAGFARLGFIASFISEPVLKGFIVGLALTIIIGQVPKLLGVEKVEGNFFAQAWGVIKGLPDTEWRAMVVGAACLIVVVGLKRWMPLVPGALVAVALGIGLVALFGLDEKGVAIVGQIDSGLPDLGLPEGLSFHDYIDLLGPAVGVLLIGFAEGLGAAKTYAVKNGYTVDPNRELLGLGAANLGSGLSSGMVVNGSLSKTAVNGGAGARTQVSGLVVALMVVLTLLFLTGLFEQLPDAALAAIVIAAVVELVDFTALRRLYRVWTDRLGSIYGQAARPDFAAAIAAMLGVLLFDTLPGLMIGIGISMLLLLYRSSRPHVATLVEDGDRWVDIETHPRADDHNGTDNTGVLVVRVESGLYFANADFVRTHLEQRCTPGVRHIVLDAQTSPFIDVSAAQMLLELRDALARKGVTLRVARGIGQFDDVLKQTGSDTMPLAVYPTVRAAVADPDGTGHPS
ncbi:SulP family inorganic anion transporter [Dietzia sp. NPDC055877]